MGPAKVHYPKYEKDTIENFRISDIQDIYVKGKTRKTAVKKATMTITWHNDASTKAEKTTMVGVLLDSKGNVINCTPTEKRRAMTEIIKSLNADFYDLELNIEFHLK